MTFLLGYCLIGMLFFLAEVLHPTSGQRDAQALARSRGFWFSLRFSLLTLLIQLPLIVAIWPASAVGFAFIAWRRRRAAADAASMSPMSAYRRYQREHHAIRAAAGGYTPDEGFLLEEMTAAWNKLTPEEQAELQAEEPRS